MPVAARLESFEGWSKERGLVTRDVDRRRVARELLELANGHLVQDEHIETLTKRYRDGLMGARSVLAARRVAQELLEWQDEAGTPPVVEEPQRPRSPYGDELEEELEKEREDELDDEDVKSEPPSRKGRDDEPAQESADLLVSASIRRGLAARSSSAEPARRCAVRATGLALRAT